MPIPVLHTCTTVEESTNVNVRHWVFFSLGMRTTCLGLNESFKNIYYLTKFLDHGGTKVRLLLL